MSEEKSPVVDYDCVCYMKSGEEDRIYVNGSDYDIKWMMVGLATKLDEVGELTEEFSDAFRKQAREWFGMAEEEGEA